MCRVSRRKLLARLRREIQTLQQLDGCESAIGFDGAFESDTHVYLVMEVVDGGDLSDVLQVHFCLLPMLPTPCCAGIC